MKPYQGGGLGGIFVFLGLLSGFNSSTDVGEVVVWLICALVVGVLFTGLLTLPRPRMTWKWGMPYVILSAGFGLLIGAILSEGSI